MTGAVVLGGWGMAAAGWTAACLLRRHLARELKAVARACHELRGPLTAVRLGVESSARARGFSPARLRAIDLELGRAGLALDDLTTVGQRRARVHGRRHERVDVAALVNECVEAWGPVAHAAGAEIRIAALSGGVVAHGDRLRLAQALGNLIANAIEHGGPTIVVTLRRATSALRIEVQDDGPGLPGSVAELGLGQRRDLGLASLLGPTLCPSPRGHGLAIAMAVAHAHGGRLAAAPGKPGARLILELPAAGELALRRFARV
jgi:signal transduction histidine kinase